MIKNIKCPAIVADCLTCNANYCGNKGNPIVNKSQVIRHLNAQYFFEKLAGYILGLFLFRLSALAYFLLLDLCAL